MEWENYLCASPGICKADDHDDDEPSELKKFSFTTLESPWTGRTSTKIFLSLQHKSLTHSIMQRHNINLHYFPPSSIRGRKLRLQFDNSLKYQGTHLEVLNLIAF